MVRHIYAHSYKYTAKSGEMLMWEVIEYEFTSNGQKVSLQETILTAFQAGGLGPGGSLIHDINSHYQRSQGFLSKYHISRDLNIELSAQERQFIGLFLSSKRSETIHMIEKLPFDLWSGRLIRSPLSPGCSINPSQYGFYTRAPLRAFNCESMKEVLLPSGIYIVSHRHLQITDSFDGSNRTVNVDGLALSGSANGSEVFTYESVIVEDLFSKGLAIPCFVMFEGMITHKLEFANFVDKKEENDKYISVLYKEGPAPFSGRFVDEMVFSWRPGEVVPLSAAYLWTSWFFHPEMGVHKDEKISSKLRGKALKFVEE